jgi:hypothetical protein
MLIALLAVLGVDLIVIVVLLGVVLTRRRWVSHQAGAFKGAIRVVHGEVHGLKPKWKRGFGRWVGEVFVWNKGPFLFRNELVVAQGLSGEIRAVKPAEVKRLGKHPDVVPLLVDSGAQIEVAVPQDRRDLAGGPFAAAVPGPGSRRVLSREAPA